MVFFCLSRVHLIFRLLPFLDGFIVWSGKFMWILSSSDLKFVKIKGHEVRALSSTWVYLNSMPLDDVMRATYWHSESTFSSFYLRSPGSQENDLRSFGPPGSHIGGYWVLFLDTLSALVLLDLHFSFCKLQLITTLNLVTLASFRGLGISVSIYCFYSTRIVSKKVWTFHLQTHFSVSYVLQLDLFRYCLFPHTT